MIVVVLIIIVILISDTGSQGSEQAILSVTPNTQNAPEQPIPTHLRPSSPPKIKKEPPEIPVSTVASSTVTMNGVTQSVSSSSLNQIPASPAITTADVTASPRKKPRKQNV